MISWVEKEHEIMSVKGFFEQVMSGKQSSFQELLMLIAPTILCVERFAGCVSDWSILNNDRPNQKTDLH